LQHSILSTSTPATIFQLGILFPDHAFLCGWIGDQSNDDKYHYSTAALVQTDGQHY
jgi:hypothetical protein